MKKTSSKKSRVNETNVNAASIESERCALTLEPLEPGAEISIREVKQIAPGGTITWYANGPPGGTFTISLERVSNSGGHFHGGNTNKRLAVGNVSPNTIVLPSNYPQNIPAIYTASDVCGSIRIIAQTSKPSIIEHLIEVLIPGLQPIPSTENLKLKSPTAIHPSPYWATPLFIDKLLKCADEYNKLTKKHITVTDASLQWGGRFDLKQDWSPPHKEHRNGNQADIRSNDMSEDDKKIFLKVAANVGLSVLNETDHWHVRG